MWSYTCWGGDDKIQQELDGASSKKKHKKINEKGYNRGWQEYRVKIEVNQ